MSREVAAAPAEAEYRRIEVPSREVDEATMVARPADGGPVLLPATAGRLWQALATWMSASVLETRLAELYPAVPGEDRQHAVQQILRQLEEDGLVERR